MKSTPVIAIFDVGKTNKKLLLFDEDYKIVFEKSARFTETEDEDGFPCENIDSLRLSVYESLSEISKLKEFEVKAINFSAYGASFVYVDEQGEPLTPLYSYLKPYPENLSIELYAKYGERVQFAADTASPILGSLNSGLQLYRIKKERPEIFKQIKYALHLPQYLSFLISGQFYTDITSIGCHTAMWNFDDNAYHKWIEKEKINIKLPSILPANKALNSSFKGKQYHVGIGLHDSSAALIPYLVCFNDPFILISTGTWCISMNPFNQLPLTQEELNDDCLCYLQYQGKPVKASRLFSGNEYELQVKRIANHFNLDPIFFRSMIFEPEIINSLNINIAQSKPTDPFLKESVFKNRDLDVFESGTAAYHQLMLDLIHQQVYSTSLILKRTAVRRIFVDGGFSKNKVYMNLMAIAFPQLEVFAASMAQATAIGAALAIHSTWNSKSLPSDIIELKHYAASKSIANSWL